MKATAFIFDFDGVILLSFEECYGISQELHPGLTREEYRAWFCGNVFDHEKVRQNTDVRGPSADDPFFSRYAARMHAMPLCEGIARDLRDFSRHRSVSLVSSTVNSVIADCLRLHGMCGIFDAILGGDVHPSKVRKFEMLMSAKGVDPEQCVFVTDTLGDLREAESVGIDAVAVTWGFHPRETLEQGTVVACCDTTEELFAVLRSFS